MWLKGKGSGSKAHKSRYHSDNPKYFPFACEDPECQNRYAGLRKLQRHIIRNHPSLAIFRCTDCDETFDFKCQLEIYKFSHLKGAQPSHSYVFKCPSCGALHRKYFRFKNHMKLSHDVVMNHSNFDPSMIVRFKRAKPEVQLSTTRNETLSCADQSNDKISSKDMKKTGDPRKTSGYVRKQPKRKKCSERFTRPKKRIKSSKTQQED